MKVKSIGENDINHIWISKIENEHNKYGHSQQNGIQWIKRHELHLPKTMFEWTAFNVLSSKIPFVKSILNF